MKDLEQIDQGKLEAMCVSVNECGIDNPIEIAGAEKAKLVEDFTSAIESMTEVQQEKLPDEVAEFYNDMYADEAAVADPPNEGKKEPEKKEPEKKEPPTKKETAKKEKKTKKDTKKKTDGRKNNKPPVRVIEKDDYGFVKDSKPSKFIQHVIKTPCKMSEVKTLEWNDNKQTFYDAFNSLVKRGLAEKDEAGLMHIKPIKE